MLDDYLAMALPMFGVEDTKYVDEEVEKAEYTPSPQCSHPSTGICNLCVRTVVGVYTIRKKIPGVSLLPTGEAAKLEVLSVDQLEMLITAIQVDHAGWIRDYNAYLTPLS